MVSPASSPPPQPQVHRPLCPACDATSIRIRTSIEVQVDVVVKGAFDDLWVVDEALGDATWDERSPAFCPECEWRGTVGDLHHRALVSYATPERQRG